MIASMPSLVAADFVAAKVSYGAIAPMLIIFGAALVGVLVEAFAPRAARFAIQVGLTPGRPRRRRWPPSSWSAATTRAAPLEGAVVVDGPALFLQGTVLVLSILGVLTMAERFDGVGPGRVHPPGRRRARVAAGVAGPARRCRHTEVFPLTLFAVVGMLLFPAAGDLLRHVRRPSRCSRCRCTSSRAWPAAGGCCPRRRR